MKTREEIQRNWETSWFTPLADSQSLSFEQRANIKTELRKEVFWVATLPGEVDLQEVLNIRLTKIQTILDANDGDASAFDVYYQYRQQFFTWCLA
jgi:hypothetical protein